MDSGHDELTPGIAGFRYEDLYSPAGLERLDKTFVRELEELRPELHAEYRNYRAGLGKDIEPTAVSELLVQLAPVVGRFIARLFGVTAEHDRQREAVERELDSIFVFRTQIVGQLKKRFKGDDPSDWDRAGIEAALCSPTASTEACLRFGAGCPKTSGLPRRSPKS
jgi:hypothetical protein